MKVKECNLCPYFQRKRWVTYHTPNNYHAIGITHAYGYCSKYKRRCLEIKKCYNVEEIEI